MSSAAEKELGRPDMIVSEGVDKWYGDFQALKKVSATIAEREVVVVLGPSGSGKSTWIRCINRLEAHQDGRILVDGVQHGAFGGDAHGRLRERRRRRGGVVKLAASRARVKRRRLALLVVILARRLDGGSRGRHRVEQIQRRVQRIPVEVASKVRGVERHERGASAAGASLGANRGFPRDPHDVRGGERVRRARKPRQPHHV